MGLLNLLLVFACVGDLKYLVQDLEYNYAIVNNVSDDVLSLELVGLIERIYGLINNTENAMYDPQVRKTLATAILLNEIVTDPLLKVFKEDQNLTLDEWLSQLIETYGLNYNDFLESGLWNLPSFKTDNNYFVANLKEKIGQLLVTLYKSDTLDLAEKFYKKKEIVSLIRRTYLFLDKISDNYPDDYSMRLIYYNNFNDQGQLGGGGKNKGRTILWLQSLLQHVGLNESLVFPNKSVLKLNIVTRNFELPFFKIPTYNSLTFLDFINNQ